MNCFCSIEIIISIPLAVTVGTPPSANVWNIFETRCDGRKIPLDGGVCDDDLFSRLPDLLFVRLLEPWKKENFVLIGFFY